MLVLSRRVGEEIVIAGNIRLTVLGVKGDRVRLGIAAPSCITVHRQEVHDRQTMMPLLTALSPSGEIARNC